MRLASDLVWVCCVVSSCALLWLGSRAEGAWVDAAFTAAPALFLAGVYAPLALDVCADRRRKAQMEEPDGGTG